MIDRSAVYLRYCENQGKIKALEEENLMLVEQLRTSVPEVRQDDGDRAMDIAEIADFLQVGKDKARALLSEGLIRGWQVPGCKFAAARRDVLEYRESCRIRRDSAFLKAMAR